MMATCLLCRPIGVEGLEVWARCYGTCFGFPGECRRDGDGNMVECVFMSYSRLQARICRLLRESDFWHLGRGVEC